MSTSLILAFKTTEGKICNLRINGPKPNITRAQAEAVMEAVIDKNIFETSSGATFAAIDNVYTIVTTKNEVIL